MVAAENGDALATAQPVDPADAHRERMRLRSREHYARVSELGDLPEVIDPERRQRCGESLFEFLVTYFPNSAGLKEYSDDHREVIGVLQDCLEHGGLFAEAIYRGFAKTTIGELAVLWAALYGKRRYSVIFAFNTEAAEEILDSIKGELFENDLLAEDFPEVCVPIRAIDNKPLRARSQTHQGKPTRAVWKNAVIVLPTIEGAASSTAVIRVRARDKARGLKYQLPDGTKVRPDFFLADDIQSDESADSPPQVQKQLRLIAKSWVRLSGHHKRMAGVVLGTIIEPGDVMDQLTNPKLRRFHAWRKRRIPMVKQWGANHETFWLGEYADLRRSFGEETEAAQQAAWEACNRLYLEKRAEADAGCVVSWQHCYDETEVSAIQHAYNVLIDDGQEAFDSECQCDPSADPGDVPILSAEKIITKQSGHPWGIVPADVVKLTGFIDQQDDLLYWMLCGWADGFTGYVLAFGAWPEQRRPYWTLEGAHPRLSTVYPTFDTEGALWEGLRTLTEALLGRPYARAGGGEITVDRLGIDTNYGGRTDLIRKFITASAYRNQLMPTYGRGVGPSKAAMSHWRPGPGGQTGVEWMLTRPAGQLVPNLQFDSWYWAKRAIDALALPIGSTGSLTLPSVGDEEFHRVLADHIRSQYFDLVKSEATGRAVYQAFTKPNQEEHFFDCLVGNFMIADFSGVRRPEVKKGRKKKRKRKRVKAL